MDAEDLLNELANLYEKANVESTGSDIIEIGIIDSTEAASLQAQIGKSLKDFKKVVKFSETRHIVKVHSKNHEKLNGQISIDTEHFIQIPDILLNFDSITFQPRDHQKGKHKDSILFEKGNYTVVFDVIYNKKELTLKTMWVKK